MSMLRKRCSIFVVLSLFFGLLRSQDCSDCSAVTTLDVDLSANPDTVWISPSIGRSGQCCHGSGSDVCIRFNLTTHPQSKLMGFTLAEPPIPPSMEYGLNCGMPQSVDIPLCISGSGPHCVTYCKPGGDLTRYKIILSRAGYASPDIAVGDGCSGTIWAKGFDLSTIRWNVIYPNSAYNSYLSCLSGCENVTVAAQPGFPEYIDVEVSGMIQGGCSSAESRDTVRVYFVSDKSVEITPRYPAICYGGSSVTITANALGGGPPYRYLWSNGATTQSIDVTSPGTYSVTVTDTTTCPPVFDAVVVTEHLFPITVNAGDALVCASVPQVSLNAEVEVAEGVIWEGGSGTFLPSNTSLTGIYSLSPYEIINLGATLTVTSTGNRGCPPASDNIEIVLSPEPIVDAGISRKVCQITLDIALSGQIIGEPSQGVWSTLGTGSFSDPKDLHATYYASSADTALGYVSLVLSSIANGVCEPVRDTVTIEFGNLPSTNFSFSQPACAGEPMQFNDRTVVSWGTVVEHQWDFDGEGSSFDRSPFFVFNSPGTYAVTLKTITDQGCENKITKQVVVSDDPVADFEYTKVCFGSGVSFQNKSLDAVAWNWNFNNGFVSTVESPSGIIFGSDGVFDVQLVAVNVNGCQDTVVKQVEVLPRPKADFQVENICAGDNVTFVDNSTLSQGDIISWHWDFGDGTVSALQNPIQSFSTSNPLNVKLKVSSELCSDSIIRQVTPLQKPVFFASPSSGCSPLQVDFYNSVQPNVYYQWDFGDGNTSPYPNATNLYFNNQSVPVEYEVTLHARSIFGCSDSVKGSVMVYPKSTSKFSVDNQGVCDGDAVVFSNESENAVSFLWDFGVDYGKGTDENPTQVFTNETTETLFVPVKLITSSVYNCFDTVMKYITVYPVPSNQIALNDTQGCHPAVFTLTAQPGAQKYEWDFGDGSFEIGSNEMNHVFANESDVDKNFDIELAVTSLHGCISTANASVLVHPSPIAKFSLENSMGCSPLDVHIANLSEDAVSYNWSYGDGTESNNSMQLHSHQFENKDSVQKSYKIILDITSANGCVSRFSESVTVFPEVAADFVLNNSTGCSPLIVDFTNISVGGNSFFWDFGDGDFSTNKNARHTFLNEQETPVIYMVKLAATSSLGCIDYSEEKQIIVNPRPKANFDIPQTSGCSPFVVPITNNTVGASSFSWQMSNGFYSPTNITSYEFVNTTGSVEKHIMTLTASNIYNCSSSSIQSVTVFPEVEARFGPSARGCSPLTVQFMNFSVNAYSYLWDFDDNNRSSIVNPENTFVNEGVYSRIYNVSLTAISDYGCESVFSVPVEVYPTPNPDFSLNTSNLQYPETSVIIENNTEGDWVYDWNFDDGTILGNVKNPLTHTFPDVGVYEIALVAKSPFCRDTITHTVMIHTGEIIADYDSSYLGCVPLEVSFFNKSKNAMSYLWDFGDGSTSSAVNPTHIYDSAGTFVVELTALNATDQAVSRKHTVTVFPAPKVAFSVAPAQVYMPNAMVSFYNQSEGGLEYRWDFGNGDISSDYQTAYIYQEPGVYDISLYAISGNGCEDSLLIEQAVAVSLECLLSFPNAFTPADTEKNGDYNPEVPEVTNDIFHPVYKNIVEYNLQIFNRWGELIFESNDIDVGWNGYYKNILSKQDVYVWQAEATCLGGSKMFKSGSVTLMR